MKHLTFSLEQIEHIMLLRTESRWRSKHDFVLRQNSCNKHHLRCYSYYDGPFLLKHFVKCAAAFIFSA